MHPLQHPLDESWRSTRRAGSPEGRWPSWGQGCSRPVQIPHHSCFLFLSLILHQFSRSLWAKLYSDAESQKFQLFLEGKWDCIYPLASLNEPQPSTAGELLHFLLIPTVSLPGTPQVLSRLSAGPGPSVLLTNPPWPQASPWEVQPLGHSWPPALGWLSALISYWLILILSVHELKEACTYLQGSCSQVQLQHHRCQNRRKNRGVMPWDGSGEGTHWLHACCRMSLLKKYIENGFLSCHNFSDVLLLCVSQGRLYQPRTISVASG